MTSIWKIDAGKLVEIGGFEKNCWINITKPSTEEIEKLKTEYQVPSEFIEDILDTDERSRIEIDDIWKLVVIRIPVYVKESTFLFSTVPIGILFSNDCVITICGVENDIIKDITDGKVKDFKITDQFNFVLNIFNVASSYYMRYMKIIVRSTTSIQQKIEKSIENSQLNVLMNIEKCLVYFTTSIKNNEILLEKIKKAKYFDNSNFDEDLYEDVQIEIKQAFEMAKVHNDILTGMMDAFASIISNNLNFVMKRLTIITIVFMPLNIIASIGGMSEFTMMTPGVDWKISYSAFTFAMVILGYITYLIIKRMK